MINELVLKCVFITFSMIKSIYLTWIVASEIDCTNLVYIPHIYGWITMGVSWFHFTWKLIVVSILLYQMKRRANFEFKRLIFPTTVYFIVDCLSYCLCIYVFTMERLDYLGQSKSSNLNRTTITIYLLNIPQILVGLSIVHLKDFKDPI